MLFLKEQNLGFDKKCVEQKKEFGDFPIFGVRSLISAQQRGQEESKTPIFLLLLPPFSLQKTAVEVSSAFVTHKSGICKQDKGKGEILLFREKKDFETEIVVGNCGSQEKVIFGREIIYFLSPETPLSHAVKFEEEKRIKALWKRRIVFYRRGMQRRGGEKSIPLKSPHSTSFGLTHIL